MINILCIGTGVFKNIYPKNVSIEVSTILGIFCFLVACKNTDYTFNRSSLPLLVKAVGT